MFHIFFSMAACARRFSTGAPFVGVWPNYPADAELHRLALSTAGRIEATGGQE